MTEMEKRCYSGANWNNNNNYFILWQHQMHFY